MRSLRQIKNGILLLMGSAACLFTACSKQEKFAPRDNTDEVNLFYKRYNEKNRKEIETKLAEVTKKLANADLGKVEKKELHKKLKKLKLRSQYPELFTFSTIDKLPKNLAWKTNMDEPEIGSDKAKKGGVFHYLFRGLTFPDTLRVTGPKSNGSFRGDHFDYIEMSMVSLHPETGAIIPSLADRWAVAKDQRTVYFHIDEKATYNDGVKVETGDIFMKFFMSLGPYVSDPGGKKYFKDQFFNITRYDEKTFSVTLSTKKPIIPSYASLTPFPRHFYKEVGPDFEARYDWKSRPTTGAYVIHKEDIIKGRSITLSRVKDWWAKDRKYTKNCYNVDKVVFQLVRDPNKALEYFKRGKIDFMSLKKPKDWYEKTEFDAVFNGYIEKATFYNVYPRVPRGLYINCSRPLLNNRDVRVGLQYATNFQKIIDFDFRGDAVRLNLYAEGYGKFSNPKIKAREYSVDKAVNSFSKAGFTKRGDDGVLINSSGQRLSFTITYTRSPFVSALMTRLKEEAIKAGLEYKLEAMDGEASFTKILNKKHELCFMGWGSTPPFPGYFQSFHSDGAYEKGTKNLKLMTNNISAYSEKEMDKLSQGIRDATSEKEIQKFSYRAEEILYRDAPWIPGYTIPYERCGYWRWVKWPKNFNVKQVRDLYSSYVFWIDEKVQKETREAMRDGKTFPEKNLIFDQNRE